MEDSYKFPGGYDVKVVRKQDIVKCIDSNIVDRETALALIEQCEIDAIKFLRQGRWTGIPFLGNLRVSKVSQLQKSKEQQEAIEMHKKGKKGRRHKRQKQTKIKISEIQQDIIIEATEEQK